MKKGEQNSKPYLRGLREIVRPCLSIVTFTMCQDSYSPEFSDLSRIVVNYHAKIY